MLKKVTFNLYRAEIIILLIRILIKKSATLLIIHSFIQAKIPNMQNVFGLSVVTTCCFSVFNEKTLINWVLN